MQFSLVIYLVSMVFLVSCSAPEVPVNEELPILKKAEADRSKAILNSIGPFAEFVFLQIQNGEYVVSIGEQDLEMESGPIKKKPFISRLIGGLVFSENQSSIDLVMEKFNCAPPSYTRIVKELPSGEVSLGQINLVVNQCQPFELEFYLREFISPKLTMSSRISYSLSLRFVVHNPSAFASPSLVNRFEIEGNFLIKVKRPTNRLIWYEPSGDFMFGRGYSAEKGNFELSYRFDGDHEVWLDSAEDGKGGHFYLSKLISSFEKLSETNSFWKESIELELTQEPKFLALFEREVKKKRNQNPTQKVLVNKRAKALNSYRSIVGKLFFPLIEL